MSATLHIIWSRQPRTRAMRTPNGGLQERVHALLRLGLCGPIEIGHALKETGLLEQVKPLSIAAHRAELGP